jgi:preprotein translocase subunit SecA
MEYLRSSVNLRAYGQREPLIEYRKEGLRLFKEMEQAFRLETISLIKTMNVEAKNLQKEESGIEAFVATHIEPGTFGGVDNDQNTSKQAVVASSAGDKIGRNDPCPCGSGKKWKKCGELNTEEHQKLIKGVK